MVIFILAVIGVIGNYVYKHNLLRMILIKRLVLKNEEVSLRESIDI